MKKLIACASLTLLVGAAYAGCGTKIPVEGELSKYDEETKELTVGKSKVTLMASASIKDASGSRAKIEDLIGKMVVVSTDKHTKKGESVSVQADEGADEKKSSAADKPKEMKSSMLAESQEWTNSSGVTIVAAVQKVENGKVYFIKDGKSIPYDVSKLSQDTIDRLKAIVKERQ